MDDNTELKKKLERLKAQAKSNKETEELKREIKRLERARDENSKPKNIIKFIGKGAVGFAKASNKFFENSYNNNSTKKKTTTKKKRKK